MSSPCDVCGAQPPKYKCPSCAIKYCSLACFKTHKPTHETASAAPDSHSTSAPQNDCDHASAPPSAPEQQQQQQQQQQQPPSDPLQRLLADSTLHVLLQKYPTLRTQLRAIYTSTLEPDPDEWAEQQRRAAAAQHNGRGRGSFRGGRGGRGGGGGGGGGGWRGRGGGGGAERMLGGQKARGPWRQETADRRAVREILLAQEGGEEGEGMREFVELVARVLGEEGRGGKQEEEEEEEGGKGISAIG